MSVQPLVRRVILGAAESSLDIAGAALLPGAWPILKGALEPVLDRLKEQLGGKDPTSDAASAQKAAEIFEADPYLQEMVRSRLIEQLEPLATGQEKINADVQKLMAFASGSQELLEKIFGNTDEIVRTLDEGVDLSEDAINKLAAALNREAGTSREVRAIALREMRHISQLLSRQIARLQIRAVELVQEGAPDRALDELEEGLVLVATLLKDAPTDRQLRNQLGFIYKTLAQVSNLVGATDQSEAYTQRAAEVFLLIQEELVNDHST